MDREVFKQFYDEIVNVVASAICDKHKHLNFVDNFDGLFEEYLNQKTLLKTLVKSKSDSTKESLLDHHKVAACVTIAIMKTRLLHPENIDDAKNEYTLINASRMNEQLAFLSGMNVVISYMASNPEIKGTLENFIFPETYYPDRSEYIDSIVRALYYSNTASGFPTLLLSNVFFLLEEYHKLSYSKE